MAPQMAATVLCSPVFVLFLFVFPVFCFSSTISFTRDELLNIRQNTPQNLLPDFDYSDALLDIIVGGAAVQGRAETFGEAGAQSIKGAHGTRLLIGLCSLLICLQNCKILY